MNDRDNWDVLMRVGKEAGLAGGDYGRYLYTATEVFDEKSAAVGGFENFGDEFVRFVDREVLQDPRTLAVLRESGVETAQVRTDAAGDLDIEVERSDASAVGHLVDETAVEAYVDDSGGDLYASSDFIVALDRRAEELVERTDLAASVSTARPVLLDANAVRARLAGGSGGRETVEALDESLRAVVDAARARAIADNRSALVAADVGDRDAAIGGR
jgi:hypothetical protein